MAETHACEWFAADLRSRLAVVGENVCQASDFSPRNGRAVGEGSNANASLAVPSHHEAGVSRRVTGSWKARL